MVSVFFTYPLEVIRVRLAFETKKDSNRSLTGICRKIYNETPRLPSLSSSSSSSSSSLAAMTGVDAVHQPKSLPQVPLIGLSNFFRGFTATLCGMIPYAGGSFLAHDMAGDVLRSPLLSAWTTIPDSDSRLLRDQTGAYQGGEPRRRHQLKYWAELGAGGFAGFFSQTVSYPLEVIRRRMQVGGVMGDGRRLRFAGIAKLIRR